MPGEEQQKKVDLPAEPVSGCSLATWHVTVENVKGKVPNDHHCAGCTSSHVLT